MPLVKMPVDENANSEKRVHLGLYKAMIYNAIYEPT